MRLRALLRLILLVAALVASGATTRAGHAVPTGQCAAWDKMCVEDCWWNSTFCNRPPAECQRIYNECFDSCCISWY